MIYMKNYQIITVVIMVQDIGYPDWFYEKIFKENSYVAYVASLIDDVGNESGIIGFLLVELNKKRNCSYIQGLFVEKEYRGRGIAKRLISEAEIYTKSIGGERIEADVMPDLFGFYIKLGFSIKKQLSSSKYRISKELEKIKKIEKEDEFEL